jgi:hypothetical protein
MPASSLSRTTRPRKRHRARRGAWVLPANILPLALVIVTTILLAGIGLGIVVLDSLRRTSAVDSSIVAYYAADAGIERQLYELRKLGTTVPNLQALTGTFSNGAGWTTPTSTYLQAIIKTFPTTASTTFQFVDLYKPENLSAAAGVGRVDWRWSAGGDCVGGVAPDVELSYTQWLSGGTVLPDVFQVDLGTNEGGEVTNLDPTKGYRLRFRPKQCTADNLQVEVSPTVGSYAPMPFPGDITIGSQGTYRQSTQAVTVQVPRQDILSGIFSFAIFSECQLVKDPNNPSACP